MWFHELVSLLIILRDVDLHIEAIDLHWLSNLKQSLIDGINTGFQEHFLGPASIGIAACAVDHWNKGLQFIDPDCVPGVRQRLLLEMRAQTPVIVTQKIAPGEPATVTTYRQSIVMAMFSARRPAAQVPFVTFDPYKDELDQFMKFVPDNNDELTPLQVCYVDGKFVILIRSNKSRTTRAIIKTLLITVNYEFVN